MDPTIYLLSKYLKRSVWKLAVRYDMYIYVVRRQSVKYPFLRQVHSVFQREFWAQCHPVLSLSSSSMFFLPEGHPVSAYLFFVFPSLLSFFQQCVLKGNSYASCEQSSWPSFVLFCVGYHNSNPKCVLYSKNM